MDSNERHEQTRDNLRTLGMVLVTVGGILTAIGMISFFTAFNSFGTPDYFWCAFLGLPMLGVGLSLLRAGYTGAISRYVAGEVAPVAKDTINYLGKETGESVAEVAKAIGQGLAGSGVKTDKSAVVVRCHKCNYVNDLGAKFCNNCGGALLKTKPCSQCGELNDPDAKFCDNCGRAY